MKHFAAIAVLVLAAVAVVATSVVVNYYAWRGTSRRDEGAAFVAIFLDMGWLAGASWLVSWAAKDVRQWVSGEPDQTTP